MFKISFPIKIGLSVLARAPLSGRRCGSNHSAGWTGSSSSRSPFKIRSGLSVLTHAPFSGRRYGSNHSAGRTGSSWCYAPFCSFLRSVFRLIACTGKSDNSLGSHRPHDVEYFVPLSRPPFRFVLFLGGNLSFPFGHPYPNTKVSKKEIHMSLHLPYLFDMINRR